MPKPSPDNNKARTKSHKDLYSQHPEYDPLLNHKLSLLYKGGFDIQRYAKLFLKRLPGLESPQAYQSRLEGCSYVPYLSEYITLLGASLFSEELEMKTPADSQDPSTAGSEMVDDFYKEFSRSCDLNGRSFHQFMHDQLECSLYQLKVYIAVDFPQQDPTLPAPVNRKQEKEMGLSRGYAYTIPYDNVIDWKKDDSTGNFIWMKEFEEVLPDDDPLAIPRHYFQFRN